MPQLYVCEHSHQMLIRALKAYEPAEEEEEDYDILLDYMEKFAEEEPLWNDISPEDIPF